MMNDEGTKAIVALLMVAVLLACFCGWWVTASYCESRAYNRLTGANTTTWDAMWIELRVQDQPRKDER